MTTSTKQETAGIIQRMAPAAEKGQYSARPADIFPRRFSI